MERVAILGTGMAGFGAAHVLDSAGRPCVCYDKNPYYGGHTYTHRQGGFTFDEGGHISFTKDERIRQLLAEQVGGDHVEPELYVDNYWHGHRIRHPVQCNLNGLPTELAVRVLKDFITVREQPEPEIGNYADWLYAAYGKTFAETFPMVYGLKYHTVSADQMTTDWLGPRMYRPELEEILHGALAGQKQNTHYVSQFRYPTRGGYLAYLERWAQRHELRLDHELVGIDPRRRELRFARGRSASYDRLVSSIPLPDLVPLVDGAPADVREAAARLAWTSTLFVTLGVAREDVSPAHITYFYDEDIVFSRVNFPSMFSRENAPPGTSCIQAELYFSDKYKPLEGDPSRFVEPVIRDLRRCAILREDDELLLRHTLVVRYSNVIYDHDRGPAVALVHGFLDDVGVHYCGRYGDWDHAWTDEAFKSGERAARAVLEAGG
jgi:protoporphyrinogen oxidase